MNFLFYFFIEISTYSLLFILFYWNLYFVFAFLSESLPSLSLHFLLKFLLSIEISAFSPLFYFNLSFLFTFFWNLSFLLTFLLKYLLSLHFYFEMSIFFYWKSLLAVHFYFEIFTVYYNYDQDLSLRHICTSVTLRKAPTPCFFQCNYARKIFNRQLCPAFHAALRQRPRRNQRLQPLAVTLSRPWALTFTVKTQRFARFLTFKLPHCPMPATQTATFWLCSLLITQPLDWAVQMLVTTEVSTKLPLMNMSSTRIQRNFRVHATLRNE